MDKYINQKYGRLTVLELDRVGKHYSRFYLCRCDCGTEKVINVYTLTSGNTVSCGCHRRENAQRKDNKHRTHGNSKSKLYSVWHGMKNRCHNTNASDYADYGGRGITVCPEWRGSFESFQKWALSNGFKPDLTIERVDTNKGYSPDNCTWATSKEQARNRRSSQWHTINGETKLFSEWCEEYGISRSTVYNRMKRNNLTFQQALFK